MISSQNKVQNYHTKGHEQVHVEGVFVSVKIIIRIILTSPNSSRLVPIIITVLLAVYNITELLCCEALLTAMGPFHITSAKDGVRKMSVFADVQYYFSYADVVWVGPKMC